MKILFFLCISFFSTINLLVADQKHFVFIVTSYNNRSFIEENLQSLVTQNYKKFRIILIDDCSDDGSKDFIESYIIKHHLEKIITFIANSERKYKLHNFYDAAHMCHDDEIIVEVDADDYLLRDDVLTILNRAYQDSNVWLTYGSYVHDNGTAGLCQGFPSSVCTKNAFRDFPRWNWGHLRSFYAWLFKQIKKEDLYYQDDFFRMTGDRAYMYPMLEMAAERYKFIENILYIYRISGNHHDHQVNQRLQRYLARVSK